MTAVQAVEALTARGNGPRDDALAHAVVLVEAGAQLVDDADRLVAEHGPGFHRILSAYDVHVGAANGRRCNFDDSLARPGDGLHDVLDRDTSFTAKHDSLHRRHNYSFARAGSA